MWEKENFATAGVSFIQTDFWRLVYLPGHHHFTRDHALLFDEPIGNACGLKIENWGKGDPPVTVHTTTCDLSDLEERTLISAESEIL